MNVDNMSNEKNKYLAIIDNVFIIIRELILSSKIKKIIQKWDI